MNALARSTYAIAVQGYTGNEAITMQINSPITIAPETAPEPSTWLSLATGLGGLTLLKFRRSKSRR
jgi:hypothetical protein